MIEFSIKSKILFERKTSFIFKLFYWLYFKIPVYIKFLYLKFPRFFF